MMMSAFSQGLQQSEIRIQKCMTCGVAQRLARYACSTCGATDLQWIASQGRGTVFAATVVARAPSDEFKALAPYGILLVDLEEGARLMAHGPVDAKIGERVYAEVFDLGSRKLIRFKRE
jgi:uncharacterized OB-fold protein